MPTDVETFDAVMSEEGFGPHYTGTDSLLNMMQRKIDRFAQSATTHEPRKVDFAAPFADLSDHTSVNGLAFTEDSRDCIMVTTGAIQLFYSLFPTLLCFPEVFPHLGAPGANTPRPHWPTLPKDATNLPQATLPENVKRREVASALITFAVDFLILHEIGHVLYGHSRWPGSGGDASAAVASRHIREFSAAVGPNPNLDLVLEDHVCEVEADSYAVGTMASNVDESVRGIGSYKQHASQIGWTLEESVKYWLFGAYAFFRLFSDDDVNLDDQTAESHPLPIVRLAWIAQRLPGLVAEGGLALPEGRVNSLAVEAASELEAALALLTGKPPRPIDILTDQNPAVDKHLDAVKAKLEEVRPQLDALSYIERP
jgi:hypothetical protein